MIREEPPAKAVSDTESQCGVWIFRPSCLQPLATLHTFIGLFSILSLITWSFYTIFVSQISNIEKAFGLSSSESGRLLTVWEIGYIVAVVIASYFAPRAHLPRAIGYVTLIFGISGLINILPHFVAFDASNLLTNSTNSKDSEHERNLCTNTSIQNTPDSTNTQSAVDEVDSYTGFSKRTVALILLYIANVLQGVAKSPCYPYSAQYVDDNGNKQNTGFYMGIISSVAIFGLAIGFGVGSLVSRLYVTLEDVGIASSDPRFISAWWLGMAIVAVLSFVVAVPMMCLPKRLKNEYTNSNDSMVRKKRKKANVQEELKVAGKKLFEIVKSPIYVLILMSSCFQSLATASFFGFEPKYMENQFAIPGWKVNIILGVASITSFSIGSLVGGYFTKRFKFTPFTNVLFIMAMAAVDIVLVIVLMFVGCSQPVLIKQSDEISSFDGRLNVTACNCTDSQFLPICGTDGQSWFSPCHAGCSTGTLKEFSDCGGIPGGEAVVGICPSDCSMLWPYSVLKFCHNAADAVASVPIFLVLLRSAGEERKSLAIGLSAAALTIVAWLPGPSIGGSIVDSACLVWKKATSSTGEYCAFYDIEAQRYRMHSTMLGMRIISISFMSAALFFARKKKSWDDEKRPIDAVMELDENGLVTVMNNTKNVEDGNKY